MRSIKRLLHPGLGDYLDRLTILELKLVDAARRGVDHAHFTEEVAQIRHHLQTMPETLLRVCVDGKHRLLAVNRQIWDLTDRLQVLNRCWEHATESQVYELAQIGVTIFRLNEARAQLVQDLNGGAPEKVRS
jgi:hypothetical protein